MVEFFSCRTDDLEDYLNGSAFAVIARNRKRYSFAFLIDTENYELTGLGFGGNKRSFNFHERYGGVRPFFVTILYIKAFLSTKSAKLPTFAWIINGRTLCPTAGILPIIMIPLFLGFCQGVFSGYVIFL